MKVMAYFCVGANVRWSQEHPELSYGVGGQTIPMTDAYLDYLGSAVEEALTRTGIDGFMVDWLFNPPDSARQAANKGEWLACDKTLFERLLGRPFPADGHISAEERQSYESKAIERCWRRIHDIAKRVKPDCVIWLSSHDPLHAPGLKDTSVLKEVDWVMDEAGRPEVMQQLASRLGAHTRPLLCLVGWGDGHDARRVLSDVAAADYGIYGFAKPGTNSLPLPVAEYRRRSIASFQGNDRNIAVLARYFTGVSMEIVVPQDPDGSIRLLPATATLHGNSPVVMDNQIGHWGSPHDWVDWTVELKHAGRFELKIEYACEKKMGGSTFTVKAGNQKFELVSEETGSWRSYKTVTVGRVELQKPGRLTIAVIPRDKPLWKAISLKALTLAPRP